MKRNYSTKSTDKFLFELKDLETNNTIKFDSLEQGYTQIQKLYRGVSGVYMLTSRIDPSRFYIGSSVNLARRMLEYRNITMGRRLPVSASESEISQTFALYWKVEFLYLTTPQLVLIKEQFAIIRLKPTMNKNYKVGIRIYPQFGSAGNAILLVELILTLFSPSSQEYAIFLAWLKTLQIANSLDFTPKELDGHIGVLVFVYDIDSPGKDPIVYTSMNKALAVLCITPATLYDHIYNKYLLKGKFVLAFEPIQGDKFGEYSEKPKRDIQLRSHVTVYNKEGQAIMELKSGRELAKYFNIDNKKARAAIASGKYLEYVLVSKLVSFRKKVYVFDSETYELILELKSLSLAAKYAHVSFYNFKSLIDNGTPHKGKIYSYNDEL